NFPSAFFSSIREHGKMRGMHFHPLRLILSACQRRETAPDQQTQNSGADTKPALHVDSFPKNASTPRFGTRWRGHPFILAPPRLARYTLVRDFGPFFPSRVDRLDARSGLRPDVSDALLRRLARRRCPQHQVPHGIANSRHAPRSALSFSGRNLFRAGYRQTHTQEPDLRRNHPHHAPAWRRNLRLRTALPAAGISDRLGMGPMVRLTPRGRTEHHRPIHDADGAALRPHPARASVGTGALARPGRANRGPRQARCWLDGVEKLGSCQWPPQLSRRNRCRSLSRNRDHRPANPAPLHHLAPNLAALAARVLHRRMPQSGRSAVLAVSALPLRCIRVRRL